MNQRPVKGSQVAVRNSTRTDESLVQGGPIRADREINGVSFGAPFCMAENKWVTAGDFTILIVISPHL